MTVRSRGRRRTSTSLAAVGTGPVVVLPPPPPPPPPPPAPTLLINSIVGQTPGGTSTASLTFANGAPAGLTATSNGSALTIAGVSIVTASGSGATAAGTASFTFTTQAAGTYGIVAHGTGAYAAISGSFPLTTIAPPSPATLTITAISGTVPDGSSTASLSFAGGAPIGLTATLDGATLAISGVSITTTSGGGATAAGTARFTFVTPAAGTHLVVATGTGAFAAQSNSWSLVTAVIVLPPPPPPPPPPGTRPAKLSGAIFTQPYPISPTAGEQTPIGWVDPVDGIGPFTVGIIAPLDAYRIFDGAYLNQVTLAAQGPTGIGPQVDTITVVVIDGRGDRVDVPYTIKKDLSGNSGYTMNSRNPAHNCTTRWDLHPFFKPGAYGSDHSQRGDGIGISSGNTAVWTAQSQKIYARTSAAVGDYPIVAGISSPSGNVQLVPFTISIYQYPPITYIEFSSIVVSTAIVFGTALGTALATTPNNTMGWSVVTLANSSLSSVQVDPATGVVTILVPPTAVGSLVFDLTVFDTLATFTQRFTIPVVQGVLLDPALMSLALRPGLNNSTPGQIVGQAAVTPSIPGGTWSVTAQSGENPYASELAADQRFAIPKRYQVDAVTGLVSTPPLCLLSYQNPDYEWPTDRITLLCTDGVHSCQQTFTVDVAESPSTIIHIGQGQVALHGASGRETLREAYVICNKYHPGVKYHFKVYYNADLDYYRDATRNNQPGWFGPVKVEGVPGPNGELPRGGGYIPNDGTFGNSGVSVQGTKGHFIWFAGDAELINYEISYVHGIVSSVGFEATRRESNSWGNTAIVRCRFSNNDQGFKSGDNPGYITMYDCDVVENGQATGGAGLMHNFYIGTNPQTIIRRTLSRDTVWGHEFKCRAKKLIFTNNRFFDIVGSAPCLMDLCDGGENTINNNHFHKGPFATNPTVINFNAEGLFWETNTIVANNNTFSNGAISYGGRYGPITLFSLFLQYSALGHVVPTITADGNTVQLPPLGVMFSPIASPSGPFLWTGPVPAGLFTESNTTLITVPPALDMSDPVTGTGTVPLLVRPFRRRIMQDNPMVNNYNGATFLFDQLQFRVSHTAADGVVVASGIAVADIASWVGLPYPLGPGTQYSIIFDSVFDRFSNPNPWAAAGKYVVGTEPDGSFALSTTTAPRTAGVENVQVRATGPTGFLNDFRITVVNF